MSNALSRGNLLYIQNIKKYFFSKEELEYGEVPDPPLPLRSPPLYKHKPKPVKPHTEQRAFGFGRKLAGTANG